MAIQSPRRDRGGGHGNASDSTTGAGRETNSMLASEINSPGSLGIRGKKSRMFADTLSISATSLDRLASVFDARV
jgi:hypothetical protein